MISSPSFQSKPSTIGRGRVTLRLFPVFPSMTRKISGTEAASYYADKNVSLSTFRTAQVNNVPAEPIYYLGNYTRDNVSFQSPAAPIPSKQFRWEDVGIELYDMESESDDI
jgi:hypothetical protein